MSKRLNIERQKELEPKRMEYAFNELYAAGIRSMKVNDEMNCIEFFYKDEKVVLYPYSGWHTGKPIKDGVGLQKLLDQLK